MATKINYAQIKAEADLYKYSIVPSISNWNLTVALKNYLWQDPSITTPVKVQIWNTVRTITWPLNITINAWINHYNAWSSELATKEIDVFTYLVYDTTLSKVWLLTSRIPYGIVFWDFYLNSTNEKWMSTSQNVNPASTDKVINIGRFSAILSAGPWYTWSTPSAWFQVINSFVNESKWLDWVPVFACATSFTNNPTVFNNWAKYKIEWDKIIVKCRMRYNTTSWGTWQVQATIPFNTLTQYQAWWWTDLSSWKHLASQIWWTTNRIDWFLYDWTTPIVNNNIQEVWIILAI